MQTSVILTVIGPDRPGLIDRLASLVVAAGGNWEDSRMLRLAGQFAGMVQVVLAEEAVERLENGLSDLEAAGLQSRLHHAGASGADSETGGVFDLEVVGQDRQGIVSTISGALARLGVNVIELATDCGEAPMGGGRIFTSHARLRVPSDLGPDELRDAVEKIASDLMVELTPAD